MTRNIACLLAFFYLLAPRPAAQGFVNFESPQAHPIVVSADGLRLYCINTPDHKLAVYSLALPTAPILIKEISVGLEPVSVAIRSKDELWVVNHVSDSISVVRVSVGAVVETIRVSDEPGDIVFAGQPQLAFVTSMTNREVLVIDSVTRKQVTSIPVFGDDPRALLASPDGKTVWVAITRSGNGTTIVPHTIAPLPPKPTNQQLPLAPAQGIIVMHDDPSWKAKLNVKLPDRDVIEIDTATRSVRRSYSAVGTILFNLALRPGTSELWSANTHALNLVRFEPAIRGHAIETRITRIATGASATVTPVNLNPGVNYNIFPNNPALSTALSQVTDIVFEPAGKLAYVSAFGTDRIGVLDITGKVLARIEVGDTPGTKVAPRTKRGPRGLAHHPSTSVLYVHNRLSNSISVIDTAQRKVVREISMFDPTPKNLREGRGFLYDAKLSGNGTMACAACHIDGRQDGLAWDLGDPGGTMFNNGTKELLHPMKGPLLTQTLQGFKDERLFHWRADRPGLDKFNPAFVSLMGGKLLSSADIGSFVAFMQDIRFMPNPNRKLDDSLSTTPVGASAKDGESVFNTKKDIGKNKNSLFRCVECHKDISGAGNLGFSGLIGQSTRAAQLRGLYKRNGRKPFAQGRSAGFGYGADGSKDDLPTFLSSTARFNPLTTNEKLALERFLFAFSTGTRPTVGFARTVTSATLRTHANDLLLLIAQAEAGNCDLIVKGLLKGEPFGFFYDTSRKRFVPDRMSAPALTSQELVLAVGLKGSVLTFMGVPPGSGRQLGIDRDLNAILDADEGTSAFGASSPPCATVLKIFANSPPRIGNGSFAVITSGAPANAVGLQLLSANKAQTRFIDIDLLVNLLSAFVLPVWADGRGAALFPVALPNDSRLVGAKLYMQTVLAAPCGQLNVAASAGLALNLLK